MRRARSSRTTYAAMVVELDPAAVGGFKIDEVDGYDR